jgi:hypothetical protein
MKDELKIFQDPNASLQEREAALEELESLVQQIDNACGKLHFLSIEIHGFEILLIIECFRSA